ncbi:predicted protein [Fibroporia radiculosa]|uniref:Uncharacterized protein n=1 Tax=Fibroporia radiculosa TaxID=599839 RepID=J7SCH9_9APHY|nr:predicted protein [Fibroporia radiculosa]
MKHDVKHIK